MRLATAAKSRRRTGHPEAVMRVARDVLVETGNANLAADAAGVHPVTVKGWNRKYGWVQLRRGTNVRMNSTARPDTPTLWRCCGQIVPPDETTGALVCPGCGHTPGWAA